MKESLHFYCQKLCGEENFSLEEWNEALIYCEDNGIKGEERDRILHPDKFPCDEQCFDCMAIVGARRRKTIEIIERSKNNHTP